jgi:RNA polymerase sigma factor for flagellar operon FliA
MYTSKGLSEKNQLVTQNTQLVKRLAHQLKAKLPANIEVDDLIQAGMMGLLDAANRYEDNHGAQFETYASQRIRGAMLDELRSADWLPRGVRQNMRKIEAAMNAVQQRSAKPPTETEIAKEMQIPLREYQELLSEGSGHQLIYYEDFHDSGEDEHFLDRHCADRDSDPLANLMETSFREALIDAINQLPEREKILMGLYYEQELNLKEIGAVMGVSESRVCQLHSQAVARLRAKLREQAWTTA